LLHFAGKAKGKGKGIKGKKRIRDLLEKKDEKKEEI
jgi:hypothetical protein